MPDPSSDAFRITFFDAPGRGDLVIEGEGEHCGGGSITVPSTIHRYLFPYQVEGVKWLWRQASSGEVVFSRTTWVWARRCRPWRFLRRYWGARGREGRTPAAARKRRRAARRGEAPDPDRAPALVLAPTSLLEGWKRELAKYTLLNVSVAKTGAEAAQAARDAKNGARMCS